MNFLEPNEKQIKPGDTVFVMIPHPDSLTFEDVAREYTHVGVVKSVSHSRGGSLLISVEGLEAKLGRDWDYQTNVSKTVAEPERSLEIFGRNEPSLDVSIFEIRAAEDRKLTRMFIGEVSETAPGIFRVENFDNEHVHSVKIEEVSKHRFRVNCTCVDFHRRKRVCKHIYETFKQMNTVALKQAA